MKPLRKWLPADTSAECRWFRVS